MSCPCCKSLTKAETQCSLHSCLTRRGEDTAYSLVLLATANLISLSGMSLPHKVIMDLLAMCSAEVRLGSRSCVSVCELTEVRVFLADAFATVALVVYHTLRPHI